MDDEPAPTSAIPLDTFFSPDGHARKYSTMADDSQQSPKKREAAMLLSTAENELDRRFEGKDQALMMASNALEIFRELDDVEAASDAVRIICQAKGLAGDAEAQEALVLAKQQLSKCREFGNLAGQGKMLLTIAELSVYSERLDKYDQKTLDDAPRSATAARAIFHDLEDVKMEGIALQALGYAHLRRCDKWRWKDEIREREARAAEDYFSEAIGIFLKADDKANHIKAQFNLASARFSACWPWGGDTFDDWRTTARHAAFLCHKSGGSRREEAFILYSMSMWYLMVKESEQALSTAKRALNIVRQIGSKNGFPESLAQHMVTAYLDLDRASEAQMLCEEELKMAMEAEEWKMVASMHQMLMQVHNSQERHSKAKEECTKALTCVREKLKDKEWELNLSARMAQLYLCLHYYDEGAKIATEVADSYRKIGDKWQEALALHTAAHGYMGKQDWDQAVRVCKRAKEIWKARECKKNECSSLLLLFQIEVDREQPKEAIHAINQAAILQRKMGNRKLQASALLMSVKAYAMCGKKEKCFDAANKALALFQEEHDSDGQSWALDVLSDLKSALEEKEKAPESSSSAVQPQTALDFDDVRKIVVEVAKASVLDAEAVQDDAALLDTGMDSLSSVSFRNQLMKRFKGINLPASLMFDYPNIRAISSEILERSIHRVQ